VDTRLGVLEAHLGVKKAHLTGLETPSIAPEAHPGGTPWSSGVYLAVVKALLGVMEAHPRAVEAPLEVWRFILGQ
jgi:hypothetical protein